MDRCAVFVDAGYLYAEGGKLCCGTPSRTQTVLQPALAVNLLATVARVTTRLPVLRTYWYDAARDGIRTQEQHEVAELANVTLRLGRLNSNNQQKGVDALIYRDLITLAQHRAISDAVLLSGDEDLREGVRAAQDYGVRRAEAVVRWRILSQLDPDEHEDAYQRARDQLAGSFSEHGRELDAAWRAEEDVAHQLGLGIPPDRPA